MVWNPDDDDDDDAMVGWWDGGMLRSEGSQRP